MFKGGAATRWSNLGLPVDPLLGTASLTMPHLPLPLGPMASTVARTAAPSVVITEGIPVSFKVVETYMSRFANKYPVVSFSPPVLQFKPWDYRIFLQLSYTLTLLQSYSLNHGTTGYSYSYNALLQSYSLNHGTTRMSYSYHTVLHLYNQNPIVHSPMVLQCKPWDYRIVL